ncbi:MAG TPA: HlyD family efflux transporter periplasmic adaptor subunit [Steroidobacteraceae bacterium]|nr:HlyD family efflux transporter periplasmic adaptor subunit [Steroidobacteraceae bacterium]
MTAGVTFRGKLIATTTIVTAVVLCALVVFAIDRRPRTHDARIFAFSAAMASEINGRIVKVLITNDQHVEAGAPLIVIDPTPFEMQLRQARAQVAALKAQISLTGRQVTSQGSGVQAAESQVQKAREQLRYAQDTLKRMEPLLAPGYVTQQQIDEARTNESSAMAALHALTNSATQARQAVGDTLSLQAQLEGAEASEALAARNLDLTTLRAPFSGTVVGLQIAAGTFALSGRPLFSLIQSDAWYAIADFRETELPRIAVGDPATIWTMAQSDRAFTGRVASLGAGVQSTDQDGPDLPKVGRDLNWVVVAQRFPVWVRLDNPPAEAMHVGMTASVKVRRGGAR